MSSDKSGLYYNAVDTVITDIKSEQKINKIYLTSSAINLDIFPNMISNTRVSVIKKTDLKKTYKELGPEDIFINVMPLSIIKSQISIVLWVYQKVDNRIVIKDLVGYKVQYKYDCTTDTYIPVDFEH
ncbi:hypothetical protein GCM10009122_03610 [Fulvivirga kasyanovii]